MRGALPAAVLSAVLVLVGPSPSLAAPAAKPKKLLETYLKAKKDADRAEAWAAVEAAGPLDPKEVPALAQRALTLLAKRGRKLGSGREQWFDEKKDRYRGRYITSGKGKKGLVLGLHGGGVGAGNAGSAASAFGGVISSLGLRGVYPEVLEKTEYGWTDPPATERWVLELLKAARRTWKVDSDRVYVTGHSMGGYGTWTYGSIHADLFGGGAAFAGAPTVYWKRGQKDVAAEAVIPGYLPNLYNLPLFVYQSLDDPRVKPAANVQAIKELALLRESDPNGWKYVYEEVDGRGHGFPEKGAKPGLQWAVSHTRNSRPVKIVWQPVREWKKTFYWLRWEEPWLGSIVTAAVDREANRIDVTVKIPRTPNPQKAEKERTARTASLSFYVDDRLVDLGRDVVVTVDGKERFRGVPEPSLATLVRTAEELEDPEYVFARLIDLAERR